MRRAGRAAPASVRLACRDRPGRDGVGGPRRRFSARVRATRTGGQCLARCVVASRRDALPSARPARACALPVSSNARAALFPAAVDLKWPDVDLARGTLTVSDSKTAAGVRTVNLHLGPARRAAGDLLKAKQEALHRTCSPPNRRLQAAEGATQAPAMGLRLAQQLLTHSAAAYACAGDHERERETRRSSRASSSSATRCWPLN